MVKHLGETCSFVKHWCFGKYSPDACFDAKFGGSILYSPVKSEWLRQGLAIAHRPKMLTTSRNFLI